MTSDSDVEVSAWIRIGGATDIAYQVFDDGLVEFCIGGSDGFDLVTTEAGLHNLLVHGKEALHAVQRAVAASTDTCGSI